METVGIIVQARAGSTRLPGKVLMPLAGKPLLERVFDRLRRCVHAERLILATGDTPENDPVADLAKRLDVDVFRGSEDDVLDRYFRCARHFGLTHIVRATGDNPFVDPEEVDRLIFMCRAAGLDYVHAFSEGGLPVGIGAEIMTMDALERSWRHGAAPRHREHVNEYILENPGLFRWATLDAPPEKRAPSLRLTVDTPEDFALAERLLNAADKDPDTSTLIHLLHEQEAL